MTTFQARYPGHCHACDERIVPGENVLYSEDHELMHAVCVDDGPAYQLGVDIHVGPLQHPCPKCWTIHAGECL